MVSGVHLLTAMFSTSPLHLHQKVRKHENIHSPLQVCFLGSPILRRGTTVFSLFQKGDASLGKSRKTYTERQGNKLKNILI